MVFGVVGLGVLGLFVIIYFIAEPIGLKAMLQKTKVLCYCKPFFLRPISSIALFALLARYFTTKSCLHVGR